MTVQDLKFSVKEVVSICAIVVSLATGFAILKNDVSTLQKTATELKVEVKKLSAKQSELTSEIKSLKKEQKRMNMIVQWLYGEALRTGWVPNEFTFLDLEEN